MSYKDKIIEKILIEWAYRVDNGMPNPKNKEHISVLSEVLSNLGLSEIKNELIQILLSEDKADEADRLKGTFGNPILNKIVTYKNKNGEEQKGLVGNLLSNPKDNPGRMAAEKLLPKDGTPERDKINKELGGDDKSQQPPAEKSADGEAETPKSQGSSLNPNTGDGKSYIDSLPDGDPAKPKDTKQDKSKPQPNGYVGTKDKSLTKGSPIESEEYQKELTPSDEEFEEKNTKLVNPIPPDTFKIPNDLISNPKFPKRYLKVLERMMNTRPTGDATKWSHFSDIPGGAGQISAQAGELITMMGTSMSNDEFTKLTDSLLAHETALIKNNAGLKTEGSRIVTKSWIQAAKNNRQAILNEIGLEYTDAEIMATSWDTKNEVEALGLKNYNKNKGFSTDMYVKLKLKDGSEILREVSLKKSTDVNFSNSGAGKFSEWDADLPNEINQNIYSSNQRKNLSDFGSKFSNNIQKLIDSNDFAAKSLIDTIKSKKISFNSALNDLQKGGGSRSKNKVVLEGIKALANSGNKEAKQYMDNVNETHRKFQIESVKAIIENPKMKAGMLEDIKKEFPLKSVSDGEETMAIGPNSLNKRVMEKIFGTSDFEQIKEKLVAEDGNPPYLGYKAGIDGKVIPLATIVVREDGVGYGGAIKFEMKLDKRFAKVLEDANKDIYSK